MITVKKNVLICICISLSGVVLFGSVWFAYKKMSRFKNAIIELRDNVRHMRALQIENNLLLQGYSVSSAPVLHDQVFFVGHIYPPEYRVRWTMHYPDNRIFPHPDPVPRIKRGTAGYASWPGPPAFPSISSRWMTWKILQSSSSGVKGLAIKE